MRGIRSESGTLPEPSRCLSTADYLSFVYQFWGVGAHAAASLQNPERWSPPYAEAGRQGEGRVKVSIQRADISLDCFEPGVCGEFE